MFGQKGVYFTVEDKPDFVNAAGGPTGELPLAELTLFRYNHKQEHP